MFGLSHPGGWWEFMIQKTALYLHGGLWGMSLPVALKEREPYWMSNHADFSLRSIAWYTVNMLHWLFLKGIRNWDSKIVFASAKRACLACSSQSRNKNPETPARNSSFSELQWCCSIYESFPISQRFGPCWWVNLMRFSKAFSKGSDRGREGQNKRRSEVTIVFFVGLRNNMKQPQKNHFDWFCIEKKHWVSMMWWICSLNSCTILWCKAWTIIFPTHQCRCTPRRPEFSDNTACSAGGQFLI